MTPQAKALVRHSWKTLEGREARLSQLFYDRLFVVAPAQRALFANVDMAGQGRKFTDMLAAIVRLLDHPVAFVQEARSLAERHTTYRVQAADYGPVGEALLYAFAEVLGEEFSPDVREAWTEAYRYAASVMVPVHRAATERA